MKTIRREACLQPPPGGTLIGIYEDFATFYVMGQPYARGPISMAIYEVSEVIDGGSSRGS